MEFNHDISLHPSPASSASKQIRCTDCGTVYWADSALLSSRCEACGNIAYHPSLSAQNSALNPQGVEPSRLLPVILAAEPAASAISQEHHWLSRQSELDPLEIENISIRNQSEWELWGALVRDFGNRNRHSAYLSFLGRNLCFDKGAARYREHRKLFIGSKTDFWQAEIADEMLEKIQQLCWVQLERALGSRALKPGQVLAASEYRGVMARVPWGLWLALALVLVGAAVANIR